LTPQPFSISASPSSFPTAGGLCIGHRSFDLREAPPPTAGATDATFAAVVRDADHPARP